MVKSNYRTAAEGEHVAAASRGNNPLRGVGVAGVARRVGKKVVSLLDYTAPYRGDILL